MTAFLRKNSILLGNIALAVVMVLGLAYLAFVSLNWRPWQSTYDVMVKFPISGGLQETSKVTLRGVEIGDVDSIQVTPRTVDVKLRLRSDHKINRNAKFSALGLSAAGEQYVDIVPTTDDGPFLKNGDVIEPGQTAVTVPFSTVLESSLDLISQVDTEKLSGALQELTIALNDDQPNQLKSIFQSGGTIFAQLYKVMPQTTKLIQDAGTILKTTADIQPDLSRLIDGGAGLINAAVASDRELRTLLGTGPGRITSLTGSLDTITDPITDVLGQFLSVAQQGALRAPTLAVLLPSIRDGSAQAQKMFHDGAWWAMASIYPRPYCDYAVTPTRPTVIMAASVPTNLYCVTEDQNQQRRGSVNAPRPKGDDTAGPPPGYDPNSRTVPLK
ncbi:MlaD family protein [Gordonia sp. PP30]|uniref:MlaD family protein n=1 Tax=Gordonia sp. PP30 TaxID=2935861 RepID=UPI001FFEE385|nr:MlaD family protein [Gordonia sp. PP30]UQE73549.1 MlaD family protein [Gordonia sp. PP30]